MRTFLILVAFSAAPVAAAPVVSPGQWQSVMTVEELNMPGMPPEALAMMRKQPAQTVRYCLTPQEAEASPEKLLSQDKSCKLNRFRMAGGQIDAEMTCRTEQGPATMTMQGSYQADSYEMRTRMVSGPMTMAGRVSARRLGPCGK